jgi:Gene product 88
MAAIKRPLIGGFITMTIKLSKTSKLDGIMSWSLQALDTCPGSKAANGQLVDACRGCYATTGNYRFKNVKAPREFNREDWQRGEWVNDMIQALDSSRYFRWFDSGDMYALELAEKMLQVMEATPWVKHWLPTRMHKFAKFAKVIAAMEALPNVVVRRSSDSVSGQVVTGATSSTIISNSKQLPSGATLCRAYEHNGTCNGCRACYDKATQVIAYMAHGKSMAKVIRIMEAA